MTEQVTTPAPITDAAITEAAARLRTASESATPVAPVRDLIGTADIAAAYAVQQVGVAERLAGGARRVGRKIGLTSEAVQAQLGVDQPDFGVLFDDMVIPDGGTLATGAVLQPRAEAELAFVLADDLDGEIDAARVRAAIAYGVAAIEICGSRVADWDISFGDTVADNASAGAYVLGTDHKTLAEFEPREVTMTMSIDDAEVSTGTGAACLGDPIEAVVWLAEQVRDLGEPLRAGEIILSGALGPMRPITAGATVSATVAPLGTVTFTTQQ
ncbi:2-keto-4-pentenoate hydratase [Gordonia desulfuricans]|uniref:2-keto-4-pentenoate hydratase n=1 Tax=Gordonia desulfuricans TaxID=89051 RepID=A0A7K3LLX5_9ACTN|nr:fumarylacetoacetate hydrolase family protein [Gordonia desulfuricans]NDK89051.1 2-keto-4-pentenoate hydratase [Gordonia desulfuricans]